MSRTAALLLGATFVAIAAPALAHHSTALFHWGKETRLANATVERWDWTNPHVFLYVTTPKKGGGTERWAFEGMSPSHLSREGWSKRTLKPGDKIDVGYYALKDGRRGGFNVSVTLADGKTLRQLPAGAPPSAAQQR